MPTEISVKKSLRVGVLSAPGSMDPRQAGDTITALVLEQIFETPYTVTPTGSIEPWLFAEKLRQDRGGDQPVLSAALRQGIVFSDGTPLTADLAAMSLAKTKALFGRAKVAAVNDRVVFTMSGPSPRFDMVLTQWNTAIVLERGTNYIGTGPYVLPLGTTMQSIKQAGVTRLERNARYWNKAHVDELLFAIYPAEADGTPLKLIEAAKRGEIDLTLNLSVNEVAKYGITGYQPMQLPSNSTSILYFNSQKEPLTDKALRRALQHAIDTTPIAQINYERNHIAFTAADIIPPLMGKAVGNLDTRDRELLRKVPNKPSRLTLVVPWTPRPYILKPLLSAEEIARQLREYGIVVELIVTKSAEDFFSTLARGEYDMALAGWVADNPDPAEFYESLLHSAQVSTKHQYLSNLARWNRPEMDAALVVYRADPSPANRKAITDMIEQEAILVPLVYGASTAIRSRKVKNVHITPANHLPFADVELTM
ncbi:MAG: ABC transporter substrate-binding protein [Acidobacteriota bacterium]|nr:ABC transporter substrate-binding protein [Acidobacteriota bacterium]